MNNQPQFAIVIPAAGSGKRFGGGDKLLTPIVGPTVLQRAVALFAQRADVGQIVLVTARERFAEYTRHLASVVGNKELTLVEGGRERYESVLLGLRAVRADLEYVGIHDAARPLTPAKVIEAAFAGAVRVGGSVPVVAEPATLKRVAAEGYVTATVDRRGLYQAQTPQCFVRSKLLEAYERLLGQNALAMVTDDAQVFELAGFPVAGTVGSGRNIKITTADDVALAVALVTLDQNAV